MTNDGNNKGGFSGASVKGQEKAILRALNLAGRRGEEVAFVEGHGSGTVVGDLVEYEGVGKGLGAGGREGGGGRVWLGSVKGNVGHTGHGAGVCGLIKAVLSMSHQVFPPHPLFTSLHPAIQELKKRENIIHLQPNTEPVTFSPNQIGFFSISFLFFKDVLFLIFPPL